jgi:hypothetical protein
MNVRAASIMRATVEPQSCGSLEQIGHPPLGVNRDNHRTHRIPYAIIDRGFDVRGARAMLDAGGAKLGFVADTVSAGANAGFAATQTNFSVDPDQAQKLIDDLKLALEQLIEAKKPADRIASVPSPAEDTYSVQATTAIRTMAGQDPGGYGWANLKAREALENTIENIQKALDEYKSTDSGAGEALKPKD